jgi:hypothetical protein
LAGNVSGSIPVAGFGISGRYEDRAGDYRPPRPPSIVNRPIVKSRRLRRDGNFARRWDTRNKYGILVEIFLGKQSLGRSRKRCDDNES